MPDDPRSPDDPKDRPADRPREPADERPKRPGRLAEEPPENLLRRLWPQLTALFAARGLSDDEIDYVLGQAYQEIVLRRKTTPDRDARFLRAVERESRGLGSDRRRAEAGAGPDTGSAEPPDEPRPDDRRPEEEP